MSTYIIKAITIKSMPASTRKTVPGKMSKVALYTVFKIGEESNGTIDSKQAITE